MSNFLENVKNFYKENKALSITGTVLVGCLVVGGISYGVIRANSVPETVEDVAVEKEVEEVALQNLNITESGDVALDGAEYDIINIAADEVNLSDAKVASLIVSDEIGNGTAYLTNVDAENIFINGGGQHSVYVKNSNFNLMDVVDADCHVVIDAEELQGTGAVYVLDTQYVEFLNSDKMDFTVCVRHNPKVENVDWVTGLHFDEKAVSAKVFYEDTVSADYLVVADNADMTITESVATSSEIATLHDVAEMAWNNVLGNKSATTEMNLSKTFEELIETSSNEIDADKVEKKEVKVAETSKATSVGVAKGEVTTEQTTKAAVKQESVSTVVANDNKAEKAAQAQANAQANAPAQNQPAAQAPQVQNQPVPTDEGWKNTPGYAGEVADGGYWTNTYTSQYFYTDLGEFGTQVNESRDYSYVYHPNVGEAAANLPVGGGFDQSFCDSLLNE